MNHLKDTAKFFVYSFGVLLLAPAGFAVAQDPDFQYIYTAINELGDLVDLVVPVLIALALALFLWGLAVFILQSDSDQARASGRQRMIWGVIILFVAVSIWGIVALLNQLTGAEQGVGFDAPQSTF